MLGCDFNHGRDTLQLPTSGHRSSGLDRCGSANLLHSLIIGHGFNRSLANATLASSLQSSTYWQRFNQSSANATLPRTAGQTAADKAAADGASADRVAAAQAAAVEVVPDKVVAT